MSKTPEQTIYNNRWEILDHLEFMARGLVMVASSAKELSGLGVGSKRCNLLDTLANAKDQLFQLSVEISETVTAVEEVE
jgi:hypothetical protein